MSPGTAPPHHRPQEALPLKQQQQQPQYKAECFWGVFHVEYVGDSIQTIIQREWSCSRWTWLRTCLRRVRNTIAALKPRGTTLAAIRNPGERHLPADTATSRKPEKTDCVKACINLIYV